MKSIILLTVLLITQCMCYGARPADTPTDPNLLMLQLAKEIMEVRLRFELLENFKREELRSVNQALAIAVTAQQKVDLLVVKDKLIDDIHKIQNDSNIEISKIRYLKGL